MRTFFKKILATSVVAICTLHASAFAAAKEVTIGYLQVLNPWLIAMVDKTFEKETGYTIKWRQFDSGANVMLGMSSGDVDVGYAGSSPATAAITRGVDASIIWIMTTSQESLVVRDGTGILAPRDLIGKKLAVPFVSTAHFSTVFALEQFGIPPGKVTLLNMQPQQIAAAWERGDIDAAFIWDPVLSKVLRNGKVLVTSEVVSSWGKPTFDGLLINNAFAKKNPQFVDAFIKTLSKSYDSYLHDKDAWTADSEPVRKISSFLGMKPEDVATGMAGMTFPPLAQQASCQWLVCDKESGAERALKATAEFLKAQRSIDNVLPDYKKFIMSAPAKTLENN